MSSAAASSTTVISRCLFLSGVLNCNLLGTDKMTRRPESILLLDCASGDDELILQGVLEMVNLAGRQGTDFFLERILGTNSLTRSGSAEPKRKSRGLTAVSF